MAISVTGLNYRTESLPVYKKRRTHEGTKPKGLTHTHIIIAIIIMLIIIKGHNPEIFTMSLTKKGKK